MAVLPSTTLVSPLIGLLFDRPWGGRRQLVVVSLGLRCVLCLLMADHDMLVEVPRTDGVDRPVLVPGNPIKLSDVAAGPEQRVPWVGEHTDEVLTAELGIGPDELERLRAAGVIE